ncbi:MAG: hypothetical protein NUK65_06605, partial [Firmicutes bacterium]|nr:hypothetical protein [Bacillota bacterium]
MLTLQKAVIHLSKYEPSSRILIDFQLRSFKLFTRDSTHFSTNNLYVGKVSDLPSPSIFSERINLLLLKDSELPVGFYENQFINYIIIKNQHSMISIINDLQDFFSMREFVSSAIKKLLDALTQDIGIEKMLDISYEILANPLTLTDSTHHLVTHAGWGDELDEPEWQYYLKHGFMSTKFAIAIDNDLEFQRKVTS